MSLLKKVEYFTLWKMTQVTLLHFFELSCIILSCIEDSREKGKAYPILLQIPFMAILF